MRLPLGISRSERHAYSWSDGQVMYGPFPGVTSVIGIVDKSGPLMGWSRRVTAEAAVRHAAEIGTWATEFGTDAAVSLLTKAAVNETTKAADVGTRVHALAEAISLGQSVEVTEEERPFLEAYQQWIADWRPEFLATEEMVISTQHRYGGTFDAAVRMLDEVWLIDYKTSKGVYPETALQLAAYARADFIGRPGDPTRYEIPQATQFGVLHLRPTGYEVVPYDIADSFDAFLAARDLWEWREMRADKIMSAPLGKALR
jgi:hypothetical protein